MRYAKLSCIEFHSCYLQQCLSIDLFSYRSPGYGHGFGIGSLVFSGTQDDVTGSFSVRHGRARFFKMFCPQNEDNRKPMVLWMYRNLVINFFSIWSMMKVYIDCYVWTKSHIWGNSDSWDMAQNALGLSNCGIFKSNISRAKLWKSLIFCMLIQIPRN